MTSPSDRRAHVVGLGLIGGSTALALAAQGWRVTGDDHEESARAAALVRGVVTSDRVDPATELIVIATPAAAVVRVANGLLAQHQSPTLIVTDVAGVKGTIGRGVKDPRYIGGHPMAGSELRGLAGARADLFEGCTWVLTPTPRTDAEAYAKLHGYLREFGANVMALDFDTHGRLVALASHVPHLVAGALMNTAASAARSDAALLQLAAGGFRDMTHVAAGDPRIWPDLLFENAAAVTAGLRTVRDRLHDLEEVLHRRDRAALLEALRAAAAARRRLPGRATHPDALARLRVPVTDQPGVLARVTTTASELNVNIFDVEIAHSVEGQPGVLLLAIATEDADKLGEVLRAAGFTVSREEGP
jgi:prephenate dehydrogenase